MLTLTTASAGSGKTYRLAQAYLELALNPNNLFAFRGILAVTFTRKATAEIKARILSHLEQMADGNMALPVQSNRHTPELAAKVLRLMLEHYDDFAVLTLDSFFQQIIRGFAFELNLPGNYEVALDTEEIKNLAMERLLGREGFRPEVLPILRLMVTEQLEDSGKWDIRRRLNVFADQLFTARFVRLAPVLEHQYGLLTDEILGQIRQSVKDLDGGLEAICDTAINLLTQIEIENQAIFTRNGTNLKKKLEGQWKLSENETKYWNEIKADPYYTAGIFKGDKPEFLASIDQFGPELGQAFAQIIAYLEANTRRYYSLLLLAKRLKETLLVTALSHEVQALARDQNQFLLFQQAGFLGRLSAESSAPFVYMRAGVRFQHFLLDEMQDTSQEQWQALLPLVLNGVSSGHQSLVVGDVKQAIYRWREGDANLLLKGIEADLPGYVVRDRLGYNRRSLGIIIEFCNELFTALPTAAYNAITVEIVDNPSRLELSSQAQVLVDAYRGAQQSLPDEKSEVANLGLVHLEFLEKGPKEEDLLAPKALGGRLLAWLQEIERLGYKPGQVCFLIRAKKEGEALAEILQEGQRQGHTFCAFASDDALRLADNTSVRFVLAIMRLVANPADRLYLAEALHLAEQIFGNSFDKEPTSRALQEETLSKGLDSLFACLPSAVQYAWPDWGYQSPFALATSIMDTCDLPNTTSDSAYQLSFLDIAWSYEQKKGKNLESFLAYWQEKEDSRYPFILAVPPSEDKLQILTIHKAKGLEFEVVIVPFAQWKLDDATKQDPLWVRLPDHAAYYGVKLAALDYSTILHQSEQSLEAWQEHVARILDSINLAYVACTRAVKMLYLGVQKPSKAFIEDDIAPKSMADLLWKFTREKQANRVEDEGLEEVYRWGHPIAYTPSKKEGVKKESITARLPVLPKRIIVREDALSKSGHNSVLSELELLAHFFLHAHADGQPDERLMARLVLDGKTTKENLAAARKRYYGLAKGDSCAPLWASLEGSRLRKEVPLFTEDDGQIVIPRLLIKQDGVLLTSIVLSEKEAISKDSAIYLLLAGRVLKAQGLVVSGLYIVYIEPFRVVSIPLA